MLWRIDDWIMRYRPKQVVVHATGTAYTGYTLVAVLGLLDWAAPRVLGGLAAFALAAHAVARRAGTLAVRYAERTSSWGE
jgi:hypothetical protein